MHGVALFLCIRLTPDQESDLHKGQSFDDYLVSQAITPASQLRVKVRLQTDG